MKLYAVYDLVKEEVGVSMILKNDGLASRYFTDSINSTLAIEEQKVEQNEKYISHFFPKDYKLMCLGDINVETGDIDITTKHDVMFGFELYDEDEKE